MSRIGEVRLRTKRLAGEPGDLVLAVGLFALALAEVAGIASVEARWVAVAGAPAMTLPLLWRRRAPVAVLGVTVGAFAVQTSLGVPPNAQIAATAVVVVACYSAAVHAEARPAAGGLGLALLFAGLTVPATPDAGADDLAFALLLVGSSWGAGRVVRARTAEARMQQRRAVQLERETEERAQRAIEAERRRIARELHDIIAHSISLMVVQAGAAERVLTTPARAAEPLRVIQQTGREALVDMKRLLGVLREGEPADRDRQPQPDLHRLDALVAGVRASGLPVTLSIEGTPIRADDGVALSAYRIVQEALTNVLKHAGPATATVALRYACNYIEVEVADDGAAQASRTEDGRGLSGMRERVELFGGQFRAGPRPGGGFVVHARLPAGERREPVS